MAGLKEIRRRIGSVQNTRQITKAMKLVSASKLKKAQSATLNGRHLTKELILTLKTLLADLPSGFSSSAIETREKVNKKRIIVIGGERGLCGPYNTNLARRIQSDYADSLNKGIKVDFIPIGRRAVSFIARNNWEIVESFEGLPEDASAWPIEDVLNKSVEDFISKKIDNLSLYYTRFESVVSQSVVREVLLPLGENENLRIEEDVNRGGGFDLKYDPLPKKMFEDLYPFVLLSVIRLAGLESKASEHAARMTAMDAATSNASELLDKLRLYYNRARQSAITTELMDVIGGAEALE